MNIGNFLQFDGGFQCHRVVCATADDIHGLDMLDFFGDFLNVGFVARIQHVVDLAGCSD